MPRRFANRDVGQAAIEVKIYSTSKCEAYLSRGPGQKDRFTRFDFKSGS